MLSENMILRSQSVNIALSKVLAPLVCMGAMLPAFGPEFPSPSLFLAAPFLVLALFMATLAVLEVRGGIVRYRRLLKWSTIAGDQISNVRVEWAPFIGSIRFKRYLFPWGRLYFILDGNANPNPLGKGEFPLLARLGKKAASDDQDAGKSDGPTDRVLTRRLWLAATGGFLLNGITRLIAPTSTVKRDFFSPAYGDSFPLNTLWRLIYLANTPEAIFVFFVIFVFLAIARCRRSDAWLYAVLAGFLVSHTLLHLLTTFIS